MIMEYPHFNLPTSRADAHSSPLCPGNVDARRTSNFLVVDSKTTPGQIEEAFHRFTKRTDIAVLIINQHVAGMIRETIDHFEAKSPAILEVPSKEHPYDPEQDAIHRRCKLLLGIRD